MICYFITPIALCYNVCHKMRQPHFGKILTSIRATEKDAGKNSESADDPFIQESMQAEKARNIWIRNPLTPPGRRETY
ncbi:hypothetical protein DK59_3093 [Brucella abortus bv. 4 str. 292]|nr:hypothetical protein DK59_3093 [Brucella abortus bv. 4 str. 292]